VPVKEGNHTTHYSIVDKAGNAVSVTYSLGLRFGTGKVAGDAGFFLNDTMEGFTAKVGATQCVRPDSKARPTPLTPGQSVRSAP